MPKIRRIPTNYCKSPYCMTPNNVSLSGDNVDFNSAMQTATITAGTNSSTVNIAVIDDDIVEGDETFTMNLNVPMLPGITAGAFTGTVATIIDTSSGLHGMYNYKVILYSCN